ncbi:MAG: sigma-70 family RNA polymerase sigma factor [Bacteroidaceae bacterium]|nr:sigma-70 family RNA polymerase sigma factor [Bacteroidaceae bacterium]
MDETRLIERILKGETGEYRHLMREHEGALFAFILGIVPHREDAEDVLQNTFVNAFRFLEQYDSRKASLSTWLHRIAYNEALKYGRKKRIQPLSWDEDERLLSQVTDEETDEWMAGAQEEQLQQLEAAVMRLPDEHQLLLRLYYEEDKPLKEIAYILDSEASRLANKLQRIRKKLYLELGTKYRKPK